MPSGTQSTCIPAAGAPPTLPHVATRFAEDVLLSESGALAIQLPTRGRGPGKPAGSPQKSRRLAGALWHASPGWFAARLLCVTTLSRALQSAAPHLPHAPTACAALTTLYTDLTKPLAAGGPPATPPLPQPMLGMLVSAWSASVAAVREAAQVLMPACTEPCELAADAFAPLACAFGPAALGQDHVLLPDAPLEELARAAAGAAAGGGWAAVPQPPSCPPRLLAAAPLGAPPHMRAVLIPAAVLAILDTPDGAPPDPIQVLLSASACAIHPLAVPAALVPATLAHLVSLAAAAPATNAAAAAALLSSMLHGPDAARWKPHVPPMHALLERLHAAILATHRALSSREHRRAAAVAAPPAPRQRRGAPPPRAWARQLPQRERALVLLPDIRRVYSPHRPAAAAAAAPDPPLPPATNPQNVAIRLDRMLSFYHSPPQAAPAVTPPVAAPAPAHHLSSGELRTTLHALDALLATCAALDFPTFLHAFNTRIAAGAAAADSNTPTHISALKALNGMLRTHAGSATILRHVVVLTEAVLRLLEPACARRRSACFQVRPARSSAATCQSQTGVLPRLGLAGRLTPAEGQLALRRDTSPHLFAAAQEVVSFMNELCVRFPIVAAHNTAASFAIACPETAHADARMALSAAQSPVSLYHLSTGVKTHALVVDSSRGARGHGSGGGVNPIAPVAQVCTPSARPRLTHVAWLAADTFCSNARAQEGHGTCRARMARSRAAACVPSPFAQTASPSPRIAASAATCTSGRCSRRGRHACRCPQRRSSTRRQSFPSATRRLRRRARRTSVPSAWWRRRQWRQGRARGRTRPLRCAGQGTAARSSCGGTASCWAAYPCSALDGHAGCGRAAGATYACMRWSAS